MKQFIYIIAAVLLISFNANAQNDEIETPGLKITEFRGKIENNNLSLVWNTSTTGLDNYWEVQASGDGIKFSTIGMVLGADPTSINGTFRYKQQLKSVKPGMKYYRVLHIEKDSWATASNSIGLSK